MSNPTDAFIRNLNRCWQEGRWEALASAYDPDAVLLPPDAGEPIIGREAIVQTYRDFDATASLDEFAVISLDVYHFEAVDMAHMRFEVSYELDGEHFRESGLEIYAIAHQPAPAVLWRHQSLLDQQLFES